MPNWYYTKIMIESCAVSRRVDQICNQLFFIIKSKLLMMSLRICAVYYSQNLILMVKSVDNNFNITEEMLNCAPMYMEQLKELKF